jgi:hypothetical protein
MTSPGSDEKRKAIQLDWMSSTLGTAKLVALLAKRYNIAIQTVMFVVGLR